MFFRWFFFWLLIFNVNSLYGQAKTKIFIHWLDSTHLVNREFDVLDSTELAKVVFRLLDSIKALGYIEAAVTTPIQKETSHQLTISAGHLYKYADINFDKIPYKLLSRLPFYDPGKKTYSFTEMRSLMQAIASQYEIEGHQYAKLFLENSFIQNDFTIRSNFNVDAGPVIRMDSVIWENDVKLPTKLLKRILDLDYGDIYNKSKLNGIYDKISRLPFVEMYSTPQVSIYKDKARIQLFLKEKRQNQLDALLGLLPSGEPGGKLKVNGNVNAHFHNQLNAGESILFHFQSLQNNSQELNLDFRLPYVFNLPFQFQSRFNLYRRDTLFQEVKGEIGALWSVGLQKTFRLSTSFYSSYPLQFDTRAIILNKKLPASLEIRQTQLNAYWIWNNLSSSPIITKGFQSNFFISANTRKIVPSLAITSLKDPEDSLYSFQKLYAPLSKPGFAIEIGTDISHYTASGKYTTWFKQFRAYYKNTSTDLLLNEMYRLGGYNSLRGFDEESIFTSRYALLKNEYRLITGDRGYLYAHTDLALVRELKSLNEYKFSASTFWSLGAGAVVKTALGYLSLSTSIGRRFPETFDWRAAKLHVGYINNF